LKKRHLLLPCLLLSFALAACGGGGSSSSGGSAGGDDEGQIVETIEKSLAEPSPADCGKLETQGFIEQTTHATGAAAMKACREEGGEGSSESIDVSEVQVKGSGASADVAFASGSFAGQTLVVALIKDGGQWKLDKIVRFAKLEKAALIKAIEEQLPSELSPEISSCIVKGLKSAPDQTFEGLLLEGDSQPLTELAESCAKTG
jgi:hypothetical protein